MMTYQFGLDEMNTKLTILSEEFQYVHDYNPIEHIKSRLKSPESILKKMYRKKLPITMNSIQESIRDIAGIRIVCSFLSDTYKILDMIEKQEDITIVEVKDYIKNPKPNGYQSLHVILTIPVFLSDRVENVYVEVQIRTVAMDFWASLEHKIYYKYDKLIPEEFSMQLKDAATVASDLDRRMEKLHNEVNKIKEDNFQEDLTRLDLGSGNFPLPEPLLNLLLEDKKQNV
ncbi:GTP pyrophosphokinase [Ornithinibacillus halotolerans]|nr:GTP pyrophosphokinase family protein [Ornithinibacillus halotolerans]